MAWHVYEVACDPNLRIGDSRTAYFEVKPTGRRAEDLARAQLAASAPELLEMCERLLGFAYHYGSTSGVVAGGEMLAAAKDLIEKAKGK